MGQTVLETDSDKVVECPQGGHLLFSTVSIKVTSTTNDSTKLVCI